MFRGCKLYVWVAGRQPHRRSRSIETLGAAGDVRAQAYRLELERIGSMDRASDTSRCGRIPLFQSL